LKIDNRKCVAGFTLIEMVVASGIGAFIAAVSVGTLRSVIQGRQTIEQHASVCEEIRYAVERIRQDMANFYRDNYYDNIKLVGEVEDTPAGPSPSLTMRIISGNSARYGQPEGDVYDVQYYSMEQDGKKYLMRRVCPVVSLPELEQTLAEPGGILYALAENIVTFTVQYYNGYEWLDQWPKEQKSLPEMIQILVVAQIPGDEELKQPIAKTLVVTFPRVSPNLKATLTEEAATEFEDVNSYTIDTGSG
jgi:prepilin-type N-terminal cleavage/methylation domain-containing protein